MKKITGFLLAGLFVLSGCMKEPTTVELKKGTLVETTIHAQDPYIKAGNYNHAYIYLPPHYDGGTSYPTLYLLHGYGSDYRFWQSVEDIKDILDYMITKGEIVPMIVVMPNGYNDFAGSFYTNSIDSAYPAFGQFEDYIINDVIRFVDSAYATDTTKRAIAGISMGGYGAMKLGAKYPELFKVVAGFSGVYDFDLFLAQDSVTGMSMVDMVIAENGGYISPLNINEEHPLTSMMFAMGAAFSPRVRDSSYFNPLENKFSFSPYYLNPSLYMGVQLPFVIDSLDTINNMVKGYWHLDSLTWAQWEDNNVKNIFINNAQNIISAGTKYYMDCGTDDELKLNFHLMVLDGTLNQLGIPHKAELFSEYPGYPESTFPATHTSHLYLRVREGLSYISNNIE